MDVWQGARPLLRGILQAQSEGRFPRTKGDDALPVAAAPSPRRQLFRRRLSGAQRVAGLPELMRPGRGWLRLDGILRDLEATGTVPKAGRPGALFFCPSQG